MRSHVLTTFVTTLAMYCGYSGVAGAAPPKDLPAPVADQLKLSKQALTANGLPINLVSYEQGAALDNEASVRAVKAELIADTAMVPQYDGTTASSFSLDTLQARKQAFRDGKESQNVATNIQKMAFPAIKAGQKTLNVTWESQGRKFQTRLVYDDKGIVYDNVLSNVAFIEASSAPSAAALPHPEDDNAVSAAAGRKWNKRFKDYTIRWVWGSTRGKIVMDHYVITCDRWHSLCDDGGQVSAWMSLGSADGKTRRNALHKKARISKLAWAFGWATPTASFKIEWHAGNATFGAEIHGVGSAGKGSGIDSIE
jgi:hypothetical protein